MNHNNYYLDRCSNELPEYIEIDDIKYKLDVYYHIISDFISISYRTYTHINDPFNKAYKIGDITIEDVIEDVKLSLSKLLNINTEPISEKLDFTTELTSLLNKYTKENNSNTPDYLLAEYLIGCLDNFNVIIKKREKI